MKLTSLARRTTAAGVLALAAAAALVGATTPTASAAASATTNYSCTAPGVFTSTFPVSMTFATPARDRPGRLPRARPGCSPSPPP